MQEMQDLLEGPGGAGACFGLGGFVRAGEDRLDQLDIPVAIDVPRELIERRRGLIVFVFLDRLGHGIARARRLARNPAVDGDARRHRIEIRVMRHAIHFGKARRVPQLGGEVAVAFHALLGELDVAALRRHGGQREAQRVGAEFIDEFQAGR